MLLSAHLTPSTSRSSRTQLTSRCPCDLSAPRPAALSSRPTPSQCCRQSLRRRGGGDGKQLQNINRNTVIMKFCDNFAAKHFTSSRNPSCNRHHIFTIMSSISRATQSYEYSNAEHMQTYFQLSIQQKKTWLFNKTFGKKASQLQTSEAATKRLKFSSLQWIVSLRQSNNLFNINKAAKKEPEHSSMTKPHRH